VPLGVQPRCHLVQHHGEEGLTLGERSVGNLADEDSEAFHGPQHHAGGSQLHAEGGHGGHDEGEWAAGHRRGEGQVEARCQRVGEVDEQAHVAERDAVGRDLALAHQLQAGRVGGPLGQAEVEPDRDPALHHAGRGGGDEVAGQRQREALLPRVLRWEWRAGLRVAPRLHRFQHRLLDGGGRELEVGREVEPVGEERAGVARRWHRDAVVPEVGGALGSGEDEPGGPERDAERCPDLEQHRPVLGDHQVGTGTDVGHGELAEDPAVEHRLARRQVHRAELQAAADHHAAGQLEGLHAEEEAAQVGDGEPGWRAGEPSEVHLEAVDPGADGPGVGGGEAAAHPQPQALQELSGEGEPARRDLEGSAFGDEIRKRHPN
jgi:hypothetical protein